MNRKLVDKLAKALLYEGYILYPYRPSVKNSQRWTFGGIYPKAWSDELGGTDAWAMQTECLVCGTERGTVRIIVRFLHLVERQVWEGETGDRRVEVLRVGDREYQSWQEAEEREIEVGEFRIADLISQPMKRAFGFPDRKTTESVRGDDGKVAGVLVRRQRAINGSVETAVVPMADGLFKLTARVSNETNFAGGSRDDALMRSLVSTHTILGAEEAEFVSMTDPPEMWKREARDCRNIGAWPVLVGDVDQRDTILSSPIILYDYPQLAPESPGDLFDSTEIDEILTLRILTLTDEEKRSAAGVDPRVGDLLSRTEALARDQMMKLHGTIRGLKPVEQEQHHG